MSADVPVELAGNGKIIKPDNHDAEISKIEFLKCEIHEIG